MSAPDPDVRLEAWLRAARSAEPIDGARLEAIAAAPPAARARGPRASSAAAPGIALGLALVLGVGVAPRTRGDHAMPAADVGATHALRGDGAVATPRAVQVSAAGAAQHDETRAPSSRGAAAHPTARPRREVADEAASRAGRDEQARRGELRPRASSRPERAPLAGASPMPSTRTDVASNERAAAPIERAAAPIASLPFEPAPATPSPPAAGDRAPGPSTMATRGSFAPGPTRAWAALDALVDDARAPGLRWTHAPTRSLDVATLAARGDALSPALRLQRAALALEAGDCAAAAQDLAAAERAAFDTHGLGGDDLRRLVFALSRQLARCTALADGTRGAPEPSAPERAPVARGKASLGSSPSRL